MDFLPFTRPSIDEATIAEVAEVLRSGWITTGPRARAFEAALSEHVGGRPVRTMSSATAALEIALRVAGIGPGDEVITTSLTWVATANVVLTVGAKPVFVDVRADTRNIDLDLIEAAITARTRAIIPVDLAGLPVDRDRLYEIARRHRLRVIEDAAQSMGANWAGQRIGTTGDMVVFSFHANKNMTSGEGGCLVLNDESEAKLCEKLRLQGVTRHPDGGMDVDVLGGKSNLTDIAAAIGLGQMKHLEAFNTRRRALARRYFECFDKSLGFELPLPEFEQSNWHMFQPLLPRNASMARGAFIDAMRGEGIGVGVHYPAMHLFTLFREMGFAEGDYPVAEDVGRRTVTLPLFPAMRDEDVQRVCNVVSKIWK
ncbi:DegT/DnrJ/EryC1/StrS family aminotransferase [Ottowia thiooxydans]|uniref:dTDP-4-amino-4,6-dideoxygalactose transaminase n=1 Tax=Ottowia thiooxydans TaxID=219182 RepID=A0ABV2QC71_9BURK